MRLLILSTLLRRRATAAPALSTRLIHTGIGGPKNRPLEEDLESFSNSLNANSSVYRHLNRLEQAHRKSPPNNDVDGIMDGLGEGEDFETTLPDRLEEKLKKAAMSFQQTEEINDDDYSFRPDVFMRPNSTYTPKDLDLTKPGIPRNFERTKFQTTTEEVLKKADFRNVRFLTNFLTESGIIIQRKSTNISAKAQRKVAREIKTARALGLMPFTSMGTKVFRFGICMEDKDEDYEPKYDYRFTRAAPRTEADTVVPEADPLAAEVDPYTEPDPLINV